MKRLVLILAVVILTLGVGAAFAEEAGVAAAGCCPPGDPGCPETPNFDTLTINWSVVPKNTIDIEDKVLSLCTYIGCRGETSGAAKTFKYKATATGSSLRKIVGKLESALPPHVGLKMNLTRPDSVGQSLGEKELSTTDVDLVKNIKKVCEGKGTGTVQLTAGADASRNSGTTIVQLTILDQSS